METVIIRFIRRRCRFDGLRRTVRTAGLAGGGILDVDGADGVPAAHVDDDPGGIVLRVEDVAAAEGAGSYGCGVGFGIEGVGFAVVVEELGGRKGIQRLALVAEEWGRARGERRRLGFWKVKMG